MSPALEGLALAGLALDWARPGAVWALGLPLFFLALLRFLARSPRVVTGTHFLWREIESAREGGRVERGRIRAWAWWCAAGLLAGALAVVGPRWVPASAAGTWTCVVDRSPSTELPLAEGTRLAAALERCTVWLRSQEGRARVRWLSPGRESVLLPASERPPDDWLALEANGPEPEWALHDEPGTIWVTDRPPQATRIHAGLFTSGGPAVPGMIALDGRTAVVWEDGELRTVASPFVPSVLVRLTRGSSLPAPLERVLAAWSEARGIEVTRSPDPNTVLVLEHISASEGDADRAETELHLARDGWSAAGRGGLAAAGAAPDAEDWLSAEGPAGPVVVVRARRGRIQIGLSELGEPAGDPAAFALSWARLFDRCALPPAGVVALAERAEAGEGRSEPGEPPLATDSRGEHGPYVDATLALGAALCAAVALVLGLRG